MGKTVQKITGLLIFISLILALAAPAFAEERYEINATDSTGAAVPAYKEVLAPGNPSYDNASSNLTVQSGQRLVVDNIIIEGGTPQYTVDIPIGYDQKSATVYLWNGSGWDPIPTVYQDYYARCSLPGNATCAVVVGIADSSSPSEQSPSEPSSSEPYPIYATDKNGVKISAFKVVLSVDDSVYKKAQEKFPLESNQKLVVDDITVEGGTPPYTIEIPVGYGYTGAKAYHWNGSGWDPLPTVYEEYYARVEAESLSPIAIILDEKAFTSVVLKPGTVYYDMVEGVPGGSHTVSKPTTATNVGWAANGYTKIMIGTTTYLIKTSDLNGGSATTQTAPKTGYDSMLFLIPFILLAAIACVYAGHRAVKTRS